MVSNSAIHSLGRVWKVAEGGRTPLGTCVFTAQNEVLTAAHVVAGVQAQELEVRWVDSEMSSSVTAVIHPFGDQIPVDISDIPDDKDYAVLRLTSQLPTTPLRFFGASFAAGQECCFIGYPNETADARPDPVSAKFTGMQGHMAVLSEDPQLGYSGGPVVTDVDGMPRLAGVMVCRENSSRPHGWFVPISTIRLGLKPYHATLEGPDWAGRADGEGSASAASGVTQAPERPFDGRRHDLELLMKEPAHRRATDMWLHGPHGSNPPKSAVAFAQYLEERWAEEPLLDRLFVLPELVGQLVDQGLTGQKASEVAERVLVLLLPVHPDMPQSSTCLGPESRQAKRLGVPMSLTLEHDGLAAFYAIDALDGRGLGDIKEVVSDFYAELAERQGPDTSPQQAQSSMRLAARRFRALVKYQKAHNLPVADAERPFYLRLQVDPDAGGLLEELSKSLFGSVEARGVDDEIEIEIAGEIRVVFAKLGRGLTRGGVSQPGLSSKST